MRTVEEFLLVERLERTVVDSLEYSAVNRVGDRVGNREGGRERESRVWNWEEEGRAWDRVGEASWTGREPEGRASDTVVRGMWSVPDTFRGRR